MAIKKNRVITRRALNIFSSKVDFELMKSDFQAMADSRGFGFKIILDILTDNYAAPSDSMDFEDWVNATGHKRATFKFIFDDSNEDLGWSTEVIKRSTDGRLLGSSCFVYQGGEYRSLATSDFTRMGSSSETFISQGSLSSIVNTTGSYLFYGFVINDFATALTSLFCGATSDQVNFQFSDDRLVNFFGELVDEDENKKHCWFRVGISGIGESSLSSSTSSRVYFATKDKMPYSTPDSYPKVLSARESYALFKLSPLNDWNGGFISHTYIKQQGRSNFFGRLEMITPDGKKSFLGVPHFCFDFEEEDI